MRYSLVRLPKVFVFHIKRFDSSYRKIEKMTSFDELLDMSPFCMPNVQPEVQGNPRY